MRIAFYLLIGLIGFSPIFSFFDAPIIRAVLTAYVAVTVAFAALSIRPGEAQHLYKTVQPFALLASIPFLWIVIQVLPVPTNSFISPIWSSAQAALNGSAISSISVDRGATLLALVRYCFVFGIFMVACACAIDRGRAENTLLWIAGLSAFGAVLLIALSIVDSQTHAVNQEQILGFTALANVGVIANITALVRAIERHETRRATISRSQFFGTLALHIAVLTICAVAAVLCTAAQTIFATASGFGLFAVILIIRHFGFGKWEISFLLAGAMAAMALIAVANSPSGDLTLRFSALPEPSATAQNILTGTSVAGNGAGTYRSIVPVYAASADLVSASYAPTTAATAAIELGRTAFWGFVILALGVVIVLFRGALQRGRDSFYATMGTSCLSILLLESFCDASLFGTTVLINVAAILGLAAGQRLSRTDQSRLTAG